MKTKKQRGGMTAQHVREFRMILQMCGRIPAIRAIRSYLVNECGQSVEFTYPIAATILGDIQANARWLARD